MRRGAILALLLSVLIAAATACTPQEQAAVVLTEATNQYRETHGAPRLAYDPALAAVAQERADELAGTGVFSHTRPDGTIFTALLREPYGIAGENLEWNNWPWPDAIGQAMQGWIDSPEHRENLLGDRYRKIGIGYAERDGRHYFVQIFTD